MEALQVDIDTNSPDQSRALGAALARALCAPELIKVGPVLLLLRGDFGAGKTTFVQGIAAGLGVEGAVRSPSYLIVKVYAGRRRLVHADLYRSGGLADVGELGLEELLGDGVLAVEWPGSGLPLEQDMPSVSVSFESGFDDPELRRLQFSWTDARLDALQNVFKEAADAPGA